MYWSASIIEIMIDMNGLSQLTNFFRIDDQYNQPILKNIEQHQSYFVQDMHVTRLAMNQI